MPSLPHVDKGVLEQVRIFCEKEERHLVKQAGEKIAFTEWMEWNQKVEKHCFKVKILEKQIDEKMKSYLTELGPTGGTGLRRIRRICRFNS